MGASGGPGAARRLVMIGASFRTAEPSLREKLFLDETAAARLAEAVLALGAAEVLVLPTCDRLELYLAIDGDRAVPDAAPALAKALNESSGVLAPQLFRHEDDAACRHLFAVASSLDSAMPGETQVLSQVRAAHRAAQAAGATGVLLEPLLQAAHACAKRVMTETALGRHPVSMVAAARNVAQRLHGDLAGATALLVGLGDMGILVAQALREAGLMRLELVHPTQARAAGLARELGVNWRDWNDLAAALEGADIAIAAMGVGRVVLTRAMVEAALAARRRRPMLLLDTAIPGDIEPAAGLPDDAFLYALDDLDRLARVGISSRQDAAAAAAAIVEEAVATFARGQAARTTAPALTRLRDRFEAVRAEVLAGHGDDADEATRRLLNRLLHDPARVLRELAGTPEAAAAERWLMRLFAPAPVDDEERKDRS